MLGDLRKKVAIVTGGASGIGTGICRALSEQGATVVVADLNEDGAKSLAGKLGQDGAKAEGFALDVTKRASITGVVDGVLSRFGQVDILVNDAGVIGAPGWWDRAEGSDEDWQMTFDVNVRGAVMMSEAVMPHMVERGYGKQINIASIASRRGGEAPFYCASKAAVANWTQSFAARLARHHINVNAICPGLIWTPMFERLAQQYSQYSWKSEYHGLSGRELFERMVKDWIPMQQEQTPEDIGKLAAFLASDDAKSITGQCMNVDGGIYMN
ncbi:MAG: SDR family NAD(P)-dependent oxidoreductase [Chloroflexi bacterium]|nr:SDR family NAD(P)-dependent oxidoreductase [Chloroflexota bacterium]